MSSDLVIGFLLGLSISAVAFPLALRLYLRNKLALRKLISDMYHKDLLPEICRVEGMLILHTLETIQEKKKEYIEMALSEIRWHKAKVMDIIKKYEPFQ